MKRTLNIAFTLIALSGSTFAMGTCPPMGLIDPAAQIDGVEDRGDSVSPIVQQQTSIDVVFVLDTTGSMGGLIEGAKQKIWAIANQISQAQQTPVIRFGLVGYRDRGDEYVTTMTALTEDIDTVYADLMNYQARGGGDTPESVNEALFTAVERFDWTKQDGSLKLIYLVGDAPPKMGYKDDVKYQASCRLAYEQGININTIQCGSLNGTKEIWQEIAQLANGSFAAIQQNGGVVAISTPYDAQLAKLDADISNTMLDYGEADMFAYQDAKRERASGISSKAAPEAAADRAVYNSSEAGRRNMLGKQELVDDITSGAIAWDEIKKDQLPSELQSLTDEELKIEVERRQSKRADLSKTIKELAAKRAAYLLANRPSAAKDGFDQKVLEALIEQGARVGIEFKADEAQSKTKGESKEESEDQPIEPMDD
ncbi:hypothetical protein COB72_09050 [bacterium]|nr:MAG: hypothetical protein COB72_09050 [bacterium]